MTVFKTEEMQKLAAARFDSLMKKCEYPESGEMNLKLAELEARLKKVLGDRKVEEEGRVLPVSETMVKESERKKLENEIELLKTQKLEDEQHYSKYLEWATDQAIAEAKYFAKMWDNKDGV